MEWLSLVDLKIAVRDLMIKKDYAMTVKIIDILSVASNRMWMLMTIFGTTLFILGLFIGFVYGGG